VDGTCVGEAVGCVGEREGAALGEKVGAAVGAFVGAVGESVGHAVGALVTRNVESTQNWLNAHWMLLLPGLLVMSALSETDRDDVLWLNSLIGMAILHQSERSTEDQPVKQVDGEST